MSEQLKFQLKQQNTSPVVNVNTICYDTINQMRQAGSEFVLIRICYVLHIDRTR